MTMEPSAEMQKPQGLMDLKPVEGSKPWLLQQGKRDEAAAIDAQSDLAKKRLRNLDDKTLTKDDMLDYLDLSARAGDPIFYNLVQERAKHENVKLLGEIYAGITEQAVFGNGAVLLRDEMLKSKKEGKDKVAEMLTEASRDYYEKLLSIRAKNKEMHERILK